METVDYYMSLDYTLAVKELVQNDGSIEYMAYYEELDGLTGFGNTRQAAIDELEFNEENYFELCIDEGFEIPEP